MIFCDSVCGCVTFVYPVVTTFYAPLRPVVHCNGTSLKRWTSRLLHTTRTCAQRLPAPRLPACAMPCNSAPSRLLDPAILRHPVTLCDSAPTPRCHLSPPTRGAPSKSFPASSCSAETSDFPNSQLPRSAPGLRHNMTAPFAPHAVPAALACTCTPLEPQHVLNSSGMPWPGAARPSRVSVRVSRLHCQRDPELPAA